MAKEETWFIALYKGAPYRNDDGDEMSCQDLDGLFEMLEENLEHEGIDESEIVILESVQRPIGTLSKLRKKSKR